MPERHTHALAGLVLEIQGPGMVIRELLAPFPLFVPLNTKPASSALRLVLMEQTFPLPVPPADARSCFGLRCFERAGECYVCDDRSMFRTCPQAGTGHLALHPSFWEQPALARCNFFLLGLFPLLLARGLYDLHAAGVVRDGIGYLLVGEAGSGKSSAALALVAQGWGYLSDDAVLLRPSAEGVEALGFRRKFCLDPALSQPWPEIAPHLEVPLTPGQPKRFVDLEQVYPGRRRASTMPRVLVFTRLAPEERTRLLPLDPTSALLRLLAQSASLGFNRRSAQAHLHLLRELVQQTRRYELRAGRDVYREPKRLAEILSLASLPVGEDFRPPAPAGSTLLGGP